MLKSLEEKSALSFFDYNVTRHFQTLFEVLQISSVLVMVVPHLSGSFTQYRKQLRRPLIQSLMEFHHCDLKVTSHILHCLPNVSLIIKNVIIDQPIVFFN